MTIWTNADGLDVAFNVVKPVVKGVKQHGNKHIIKCKIKSSDLAAHGTAKILGEQRDVIIPKGALILSAIGIVRVGFASAGAAGTLTLGAYKLADRAAYDADGIDATVAQAALDVVGEKLVCDGALVGGVALTEAVVLGAQADTATFTAGELDLEVEYMI